MGRFKQGKEGKGPKSEYGHVQGAERSVSLRPSSAAVTSDPQVSTAPDSDRAVAEPPLPL